MITVKRDVRPEEIRQSARHVLFVEGSEEGQIDTQVLRELLGNRVRVEPLGASFHIKSAADALFRYHPDYYFLIDRDHHDDTFVEECWQNFPDASKSNLLVWRKRQFESYFLDPEYIAKSAHLTVDRQRLEQVVLQEATRRLYLDAANNTLIQLREGQKRNWVSLFSKVEQFRTETAALSRLEALPELTSRKLQVSKELRKTSVKRLFQDCLDRLCGGTVPLEYGTGRWLELMDAKRILPAVTNCCFKVVDMQGCTVQGKKAITEIARELVRKGTSQQPTDFVQLDTLIRARVESN